MNFLMATLATTITVLCYVFMVASLAYVFDVETNPSTDHPWVWALSFSALPTLFFVYGLVTWLKN